MALTDELGAEAVENPEDDEGDEGVAAADDLEAVQHPGFLNLTNAKF